MTVEQRNRETAFAVMKAISDGDSAALFRMYAPNARFWQVGKHLKSAGWHDMEATGRIAAKVFARLASPPKMTSTTSCCASTRAARGSSSRSISTRCTSSRRSTTARPISEGCEARRPYPGGCT